MPDAAKLVRMVKKAAVEAVDATKPVGLCFGTVESISPLKINVEQKMTLGEAQLVLTREATDYRVAVDGLAGVQEITIKNGLAAGEKVILARQQGGQKYFVVGRAVP